MNVAKQLFRNVQNRFGNCSSEGSIEELNDAQLNARKRKINSVYIILGLSILIMLVSNSFAMYDWLEFYIPFTVGMVGYSVFLYKEYRRKIDRINEHLNKHNNV